MMQEYSCGSLRVYISRECGYDLYKVWVLQHSARDQCFALSMDGDEIKYTKIKEQQPYSDIPAMFNIPGMILNDFMGAIGKAFLDMGPKQENDFRVQGTLDATRDHLKDMQKLVFKEKKEVKNG